MSECVSGWVLVWRAPAWALDSPRRTHTSSAAPTGWTDGSRHRTPAEVCASRQGAEPGWWAAQSGGGCTSPHINPAHLLHVDLEHGGHDDCHEHIVSRLRLTCDVQLLDPAGRVAGWQGSARVSGLQAAGLVAGWPLLQCPALAFPVLMGAFLLTAARRRRPRSRHSRCSGSCTLRWARRRQQQSPVRADWWAWHGGEQQARLHAAAADCLDASPADAQHSAPGYAIREYLPNASTCRAG